MAAICNSFDAFSASQQREIRNLLSRDEARIQEIGLKTLTESIATLDPHSPLYILNPGYGVITRIARAFAPERPVFHIQKETKKKPGIPLEYLPTLPKVMELFSLIVIQSNEEDVETMQCLEHPLLQSVLLVVDKPKEYVDIDRNPILNWLEENSDYDQQVSETKPFQVLFQNQKPTEKDSYIFTHCIVLKMHDPVAT